MTLPQRAVITGKRNKFTVEVFAAALQKCFVCVKCKQSILRWPASSNTVVINFNRKEQGNSRSDTILKMFSGYRVMGT